MKALSAGLAGLLRTKATSEIGASAGDGTATDVTVTQSLIVTSRD